MYLLTYNIKEKKPFIYYNETIQNNNIKFMSREFLKLYLVPNIIRI